LVVTLGSLAILGRWRTRPSTRHSRTGWS